METNSGPTLAPGQQQPDFLTTDSIFDNWKDIEIRDPRENRTLSVPWPVEWGEPWLYNGSKDFARLATIERDTDDAGNNALCIRFLKAASTQDPEYTNYLHGMMLFHQWLTPVEDIPGFDWEGSFRVDFRLRWQGAKKGSVAIVLCTKFGTDGKVDRAGFPSDRTRGDGWYDEAFRPPAKQFFDEKQLLLEVHVNGEFSPGDRFCFANPRVLFLPDRRPIGNFTFLSPGSGVLFEDNESQVVTGRLRVGSHIDSQHPRRLTLLRQSARGAVERYLYRYLSLEQDQEWSLNMGAYPNDSYLLTAEVFDPEQNAFASETLPLAKTERTADSWSVTNGRVTKGDAQALLLGTYHISGDWTAVVANEVNKLIGEPDITGHEVLSGLAERGFNCFTGTMGPDFALSAGNSGLLAIPKATASIDLDANPAVEASPSEDGDTGRTHKGFDHRAIAGWHTLDEPGPVDAPELARIYNAIRAFSPDKLVMTTLNEVRPLEYYLANGQPFADLVLLDIYRLFDERQYDLTEVGQAVKDAIRLIRESGRDIAVGITPQAFWWPGDREPTPQELRANFYVGLVNGAVAFFPYAYLEEYAPAECPDKDGEGTMRSFACDPHPGLDGMSLVPRRKYWWLPASLLWTAIGDIFAEIETLKEFVLSEDWLKDLDCSTDIIQYSARRSSGCTRLVAVNPKREYIDAEFRFAEQVKCVTPMFNTPDASLEASSVSLSFAPHEVKAFEIVLENYR